MTQNEQEAWVWLQTKHNGQLDGKPVTAVSEFKGYVIAFTESGTYRMRLTPLWRVKRWIKQILGL